MGNILYKEIPQGLDITSLSLQEQSQYADIVCKNNVDNKTFIDQQMQFLPSENTLYHLWNDTSVGNLAYLILYSPYLTDGKIDLLKQSLNGYKKYREQQNNILK